MPTIDITKKTYWSRAPKATGLAAVCANNGTRSYYLKYVDSGKIIAELYFTSENPEHVGTRALRVKLFSVGKMDLVKPVHLVKTFNSSTELSEAKKFATKAYKDIATLEKYNNLKVQLGWDRF